MPYGFIDLENVYYSVTQLKTRETKNVLRNICEAIHDINFRLLTCFQIPVSDTTYLPVEIGHSTFGSYIFA